MAWTHIYSLFYILLKVHSSYRNWYMCQLLIWNFLRKGSYILSQIYLIQLHMLKDHILKQTVLKIALFASLLYVFVRAVFAYVVNMYFFLPTAVIILCWRFSYALAIPSQQLLLMKRFSLLNQEIHYKICTNPLWYSDLFDCMSTILSSEINNNNITFLSNV